MRIAVFCHNYPPHPGGLEVVVQSLATGLAARHEVVVITSAWEGHHGRSTEKGVIVHRLPASHFAETRGVPYPVPLGPGLRNAHREIGRPDLVHCHGALYTQSLWARHVARSHGCPLVLTEHVGFVDYAARGINAVQHVAWRLVGDRVARSAAALVVYNERVRALLAARYPGQELHFIRNGVETTRFTPAPAEEKLRLRAELGLPARECLVLFAGREVAKKNFREVISIPRDGFKLVVCGARRGLDLDGVIDLGIVPHDRMPAVFGAVDVLVHSSSGEGFPLAIQEAMSSGLPVALLWDPGYEGNVTREVVEVAATLQDLPSVVRRLVADDGRRQELGDLARAWACDHWSWDATVAGYETLFERIVHERPSQAARSPV